MKEVTSTVRMTRKGKENATLFQMPINITDKEKIRRVKAEFKAQVGKRVYGAKFEIL